jgi:hypothetical protein
MRTNTMEFVAIAGLVPADECEIVAVFVAANMSGLIG